MKGENARSGTVSRARVNCMPVLVNRSYDSTDCSRGNSVKGDLKGTMQAKAKQYKIDLGVCKETVGGLTSRVEPISGFLSSPHPGCPL